MHVLLVLMTLISPSGGQTPKRATQNWVKDISESPILLSNQGRVLSLQNRTKKTIKSYTLGCATEEHEHLTTVHEFPLQSETILPLGGVEVATFDAFPERDVCVGLNAKLIVLSADFANGSSWRFHKSDSQSAPDHKQ